MTRLAPVGVGIAVSVLLGVILMFGNDRSDAVLAHVPESTESGAHLSPTITAAPSLTATATPSPTPSSPPPPPIAPDSGGMDAMSIDMNPDGVPANAATSLGSLEFCARINENDLLDADEVDIDTLEIDITTGPAGIPEGSAMTGFSFILFYSAQNIEIVNRDIGFMIATQPGSEAHDASMPIVSGGFLGSAVDAGVGSEESGPGVLMRLRLQTTTTASPSIHHLMLSQAGHSNSEGKTFSPASLNHAIVAVDMACPSAQPPSVMPSATPPPPTAIAPSPTAHPSSLDRGGMDAMAIDMNPHGVLANTATSLGSREFCARINENNILDADEDDVDTLEIDITTGPGGIPEGSAMIGFQLDFLYPADSLTVVGSSTHQLLAATEGSSLFDVSDPVPDFDGRFVSAAADLNVLLEWGPGILARLRLETRADAAIGVFELRTEQAGHIDGNNNAWRPAKYLNAFVAIGTECPSEPPAPAITSAPTPVPTPPPTITTSVEISD